MMRLFLLMMIGVLGSLGDLQGQCWTTVLESEETLGGDVFFSSDSIGWLSDWGDELYQTVDSGLSWAIHGVDQVDRTTCIFFLNNEIGWIGHSSHSILKTIDGGENWTEYDFSNENIGTPQDIEFVDIDTGFLVTYDGGVFRSFNGGEQWERVFHSEDWLFATLDFVSGSEGWIAGSTSINGGTRVLHTSNGGEDWALQLNTPGTGPDVDLHFFNNQKGWYVYEDNIVYKTTNGGEDWNSYPISANINAASPRIFFINDTLGWATTRGPGRIFVSTNGGETWKEQSTDFSYNIWNTGIYMTSAHHGVAINLNGIIQRYQGGPANCDIQLISPTTTITALQPEIKWHKVPGCVDGYRLSVGLIPGGTEIIGPLDMGLDTSYLLPFALLEDMDYYVNIVPYNHVHGLATTCGEPFAFTSVSCPPTNLIDTSFCDPPFVWADTSFEEAGTYLFEYMTPLGCDSVVVLALTHEDDIYTEIDTALTVGQPYNGVLYESDTLLIEIYAASNGCDSIVQIQLTIITRTQEPDFISQWQVFPNPTDSELWFRFSSRMTTVATLKLYDAQGRQVFTTDLSLHTGENEYRLQVIPDWPVGLYWYQLETGRGSVAGKIVKE